MKSIPVLLAALFLLGCEQGVKVETTSPSKGEIRDSFREPARTRLRRTYRITMPVSGRIGRIELEPGMTVSKGQRLASYDVVALDQAVAEARAAVAAFEAQIKLKADNRLEVLGLSESRTMVKANTELVSATLEQIKAYQARAHNAERELKRIKDVAKTNGAFSQSRLEEAQLNADTARIDLKQQQFYLAALRAFDVAVRLGPPFVTQYIDRKQLERAVLLQRKAQAQSRLTRSLHQRKLADLRAPIDGVVLQRYEQGDRTLLAGQQLLLIGDLSQLEVAVDVLTGDAQRIVVGGDVSLTAVVGGQPLAGKIRRIEPAGFTKLSSLGVEQQRVTVVVAFVEPPRNLGVGYRVQARFYTSQKPDALLVPRYSVLQAPDRTHYVLKVAGGVLRRQPVEIGLRTDLQLEIVKGLSASDKIVARADSTMTEGMKVK